MTLHIGRSDWGHHIEDQCPCPQAPCGLVPSNLVDATCSEHHLRWQKPIRQGHDHTKCPGGEV